MMTYIRVFDGGVHYPFDTGTLRFLHPNVSFPAAIPLSLLNEYSVFEVTLKAPPTYDALTEELKETLPVQTDSQWVQAWTVTRKPEDIAAKNVRNKRNDLLSASDWTQLPDSPVDRQAWSVYRQALRDITSQSGFPFSVVWPTQPSMAGSQAV
jgi:hypothetical protein